VNQYPVIYLDLREIKGIGDKLASKIINHFGSQEEFLRAASNYEVYQLASMDGISQRRAVEILNISFWVFYGHTQSILP